jgi:hypothetical protein
MGCAGCRPGVVRGLSSPFLLSPARTPLVRRLRMGCGPQIRVGRQLDPDAVAVTGRGGSAMTVTRRASSWPRHASCRWGRRRCWKILTPICCNRRREEFRAIYDRFALRHVHDAHSMTALQGEACAVPDSAVLASRGGPAADWLFGRFISLFGGFLPCSTDLFPCSAT